MAETDGVWLCDGCSILGTRVEEQGLRVKDRGTGHETPDASTSIRDTGVTADSARASAESAANAPEVEELLEQYRAGTLSPVRVELPPLPPSASEPMRQVADFYALVAGLRRAVCDERDVPFAGRWVARHTGLPERSAFRVIIALAGSGIIERTGRLEPLLDRREGTALYAPGEVPTAAVGVEGRARPVGDASEPESHLKRDPLMAAAERAVGGGSLETARSRADVPPVHGDSLAARADIGAGVVGDG